MDHSRIKNIKNLRTSLILAIEEGNCANLEELFNVYDSYIGVFILLELILHNKLLQNRKIYYLVSYRALAKINTILDEKPNDEMINYYFGLV